MFNDSDNGQAQYCEECQKWAEKCEKLNKKFNLIKSRFENLKNKICCGDACRNYILTTIKECEEIEKC